MPGDRWGGGRQDPVADLGLRELGLGRTSGAGTATKSGSVASNTISGTDARPYPSSAGPNSESSWVTSPSDFGPVSLSVPRAQPSVATPRAGPSHAPDASLPRSPPSLRGTHKRNRTFYGDARGIASASCRRAHTPSNACIKHIRTLCGDATTSGSLFAKAAAGGNRPMFSSSQAVVQGCRSRPGMSVASMQDGSGRQFDDG